MSVAHLYVCGCCGKRGAPLDLEYRGVPVASGYACDKCLADYEAEMVRVRPIFDAMIAAGVGRELANRTMTRLLDELDEESGQ